MNLSALLLFLLSGQAAAGEGGEPFDSLLSKSLVDFFHENSERDQDDYKGLGSVGVWERVPRLWRNVDGVNSRLFSFSDAVEGAEGGLLETANVAIAEHAAQGRWVSEYAPSLNRKQLRGFLEKGTVFFNGAGLDYPSLAALAALAQNTFGLPTNLNVYVTNPGRDVSVSPHTDAQNVLVFQTQGRKRWRVWAPPKRVPGKDPFGRGKGGDKIDMSELSEPLIDAWLEPGCVLYVPIGFPHATSTVEKGADSTTPATTTPADDEISCHVTLGLDTYFYGLTYTTLRALALGRAGTRDSINMFQLDDELHSKFFSPLPFGFLCPEPLKSNNYGHDFETYVMEQLLELNQQAAAKCGTNPPFLGSDDEVRDCIRFLTEHWRSVMHVSKYQNVVQPKKKGTLESIQAKMIRNSKNQREEAAQKNLMLFAQKPSIKLHKDAGQPTP